MLQDEAASSKCYCKELHKISNSNNLKMTFIVNEAPRSSHLSDFSNCFKWASIKQTSIIYLIWAIMLNRGLLRLTHNTPQRFMLKTALPLWWFILKHFLDSNLLNQQTAKGRETTDRDEHRDEFKMSLSRYDRLQLLLYCSCNAVWSFAPFSLLYKEIKACMSQARIYVRGEEGKHKSIQSVNLTSICFSHFFVIYYKQYIMCLSKH